VISGISAFLVGYLLKTFKTKEVVTDNPPISVAVIVKVKSKEYPEADLQIIFL
jgi:hypothetical protein